MRIAVMGTGAVGCYFGGRLALAGQEVCFIARGARLRALRESGLTIVEPDGQRRVPVVEVVENAADAAPVDAVLLCVKLYDTEAALRACRELLGRRAALVVLQNGVESVAAAARELGAGRVVGGAVYAVAGMTGPATVERTGDWARLEIAAAAKAAQPACSAIADACEHAGVECIVREDLDRMLWSKFVLLAATSAMTAVTRRPIGHVRSDPVARGVARRCMREAVEIARARGVSLPDGVENDAWRQLCEEMDPTAKASQLVDLEQGRPLELEHLSGAIHRFGESLGVPTPVHSTIYAALRPFAPGTAGRAGPGGEAAP